MNERASATVRAPAHLWIVGVLGVLWNAYGCFDYLMKQVGGASYLAALPLAEATMLAQMPLWANAAWAIGVWGGLLGCVLLLLRRRWAAPAFRLSLLGAALGTAYQVRHLPPMNSTDWVLTIAILMVCVALLIYARWQTARGNLR
jgi:hypothetical protein